MLDCRHHVYERITSAVHTEFFGTNGSNNPRFIKFKNSRNIIDTSAELNRLDYKERCLKLRVTKVIAYLKIPFFVLKLFNFPGMTIENVVSWWYFFQIKYQMKNNSKLQKKLLATVKSNYFNRGRSIFPKLQQNKNLVHLVNRRDVVFFSTLWMLKQTGLGHWSNNGKILKICMKWEYLSVTWWLCTIFWREL